MTAWSFRTRFLARRARQRNLDTFRRGLSLSFSLFFLLQSFLHILNQQVEINYFPAANVHFFFKGGVKEGVKKTDV